QLVRDANAETLFFLTWGRRAGDPMNEWMYPDFATMQERLTSGYQAYAAATATADRPVWIAPVGPAFAVVHDRVVSDGLTPTDAGNDFHGLYSGDGSHPSPTGTLLTAYVFFASITGESPVGLEAPTGIDAELADRLQSAAASAVFNSADDFHFPWETEEDTPDADDGAGETGTDQDTGLGDSGADDGSGTAGDTAEESAGSTDPTPAAAPEGDPSKQSGCSAAHGSGRITGWATALAGFLVILGRRRR
ncbi:MAG: MYXO-CTERM sorting domain-containing protein, partial [Myxococcota bacterium]|nr:MYXO-CTERM sorting domain-containing protein [Myxococcota bacterium]